jgi:hypothetical protein
MADRSITYVDKADGAKYTVSGGSHQEFGVYTEADGYVAGFDVASCTPDKIPAARLIEMAEDAVAEERANW